MSRIQMSDLVTPERILPTLGAIHKRQVIEALSRFAAAQTGLPKTIILRAVQTSEGLTTFGVGRGIAIPHAVVGDISRPFGAFAHLKRPVDFGAADGRPADLVFLLLVPETVPGILLPALSCVARRLRDPEVAKRLRSATRAEAVHLLLTSNSWRGDNSAVLDVRAPQLA